MLDRRGWAVRAAVAFAAAAALVPAPAAGALPREKDAWVAVDGPGFAMIGDADADLMAEIAARFGRLREILPGVLGVPDPDAGRPVRVFVLARERTFRPYAGGLAEEASGLYVRGDGARYLVVHASPPLDPHAILAHEYVHAVLDAAAPGLPLWFDEGLAELFSTFRADPVRVEIGAPNPRQRQLLASEGPIRPAKFLAIDARSPEYRGGALKELYHAQAWAVVHAAVVAAPGGTAALAACLAHVRSGEAPRVAFERAFGASVESFVERAGEHAAKEPWRTVSLGLQRVRDASAGEVREAPLAETLARLGDLLVHARPGTEGEAARHLDRALRLDAEQPAALGARAALANRAGRYPEAADGFARARAGAPGDAVLAYRAARNLLQWVEADRRSGAGPGGASGDRLDRARRAFRDAIAADPGFAAAHAGLGATYLFDDPAAGEAAAALDRARELAPLDPEVRFSGALLAVRNGRWAAVRADLDALEASGADADRIRFVRHTLERADLDAARGIGADGERAADGIATLRRLRATAVSEAVRSEAAALLAAWGVEDRVSDPARP